MSLSQRDDSLFLQRVSKLEKKATGQTPTPREEVRAAKKRAREVPVQYTQHNDTKTHPIQTKTCVGSCDNRISCQALIQSEPDPKKKKVDKRKLKERPFSTSSERFFAASPTVLNIHRLKKQKPTRRHITSLALD